MTVKKGRSLAFLCVFVLLSTFSLILVVSGGYSETCVQQIASNSIYDYLFSEGGFDRFKGHVEYLTRLGINYSLVAGYEGNYLAAQFISEEMERIGFNSSFEEFTVYVPIDHGAKITISSSPKANASSQRNPIKAYSIWPNLVQNSPVNGLSAPLVYCGKGEWEDFDGKDVNGSIVLLDFGCSWKWKNAFQIGAKAVIFIGYETIRPNALEKILDIPLYMPRFYVVREDGEFLKELCSKGKVILRLDSSIKFEGKTLKNIKVEIEGRRLKDEYIVVAAHYDTFSVVPRIAPGATDNLGVASLIELARFLKLNPPDRSVILLFLSGHYGGAYPYIGGLYGARYFVENNFGMMSNIRLFMSVDLDAGSNIIGIYSYGMNYVHSPHVVVSTELGVGGGQSGAPIGIPNFDMRFNWITHKLVDYARTLQGWLGVEIAVDDVRFRAIPVYWEYPPFVLDSEPFTEACGQGGIGLRTTNTIRAYHGTPFDTIDSINFSNVETQILYVLSSVYNLSNEDNLPIYNFPTRFNRGESYGFSRVEGKVISWDIRKYSYTPVVNAFVVIKGMMKFSAILKTDQSGRFCVEGVQPGLLYEFSVFVLDEENGKILYSLEMDSRFGASRPEVTYHKTRAIDAEPLYVELPVFECASIYLYDLPTERSAALVGLQQQQLSGALTCSLNEFSTHTQPLMFGEILTSSTGTESIVFIPPNTPVELILKLRGHVLGLYVNASETSPYGFGYFMNNGEHLVLTPLDNDLYRVTKYRLELTREYGVSMPITEEYSKKTKECFEAALELYNADNYSKAYGKIHLWAAYSNLNYEWAMSLINDVITTIVSFSAVILVASFLLERLLIPQQEIKKRLISISSIFIFLNFAMYFLHPGYHIASNTLIQVGGMTIVGLSVIVFYMVFNDLFSMIREQKRKALGYHVAEMSREGALVASLVVGVENMRKRKFRSILTIFSLTVIIFSLIALTSISLSAYIVASTRPGESPYSGIEIRNVPWNPLSEQFYESLKYLYRDEAVVTSKIWVYFGQISIEGRYFVEGFIGMSKSEVITLLQGEWFKDNYERACIIPKGLADVLKIQGLNLAKGNRTINVAGLNLEVKGVFDPNYLRDIKDLSGGQITPLDFKIPEAIDVDAHLQPQSVIIVPWGLAFDFIREDRFAGICSINILPYNKTNLEPIAKEIVKAFMLPTFVSSGGQVKIFSLVVGFMATGTAVLLIPAMIGILSIFNIMLGNISERLREIGIYCAVGLAPSHVAALFLAEAMEYAFISGVFGYVFGMACLKILLMKEFFTGEFFPNFSSSMVLTSIGFSIFVILCSAAYPMLKASRLVTPSIERRWKIPTKPVGDEWTIPFPFRTVHDHAIGVLLFLKEYFEALSTERESLFTVSDVKYVSGEDFVGLRGRVRLPPWDHAIYQDSLLRMVKKGVDYEMELSIIRVSGYYKTWVVSNSTFTNAIRRQLLYWRGLSPSEREVYIKRAHAEFYV